MLTGVAALIKYQEKHPVPEKCNQNVNSLKLQ